MKFWKKKPQPAPPAGSDAELVRLFRQRLNSLQGIAAVLNDRGIAVTLSTGEDRAFTTFAPAEVREYEIKRVRLEKF